MGDADVATLGIALSDDDLLAGLRAVAEARKSLDVVSAAFAAEVERRSGRELGYRGLAQRTGHRTATSLIQNVTGTSAADVRRSTGVGQDLLVAAIAREDEPGANREDAPPEPWFAPLTSALSANLLSRDQYDAIRRGLGEPPIDRYPDLEPRAIEDAWRQAATMLLDEAADQVLEDLRASARLARDTRDPIGTQLRFDERYEKRAFTMWVDEYGQQCARIRFDDDGGAWVRTVLNAALRPRRGPRFVGSAPGSSGPGGSDPLGAGRAGSDSSGDPVAEGKGAREDTRTNEQLQYDTMLAVMRTGALADPGQAFGDRQPGVRIVVTKDDLDRRLHTPDARSIAFFEETGAAVPAALLETYLCNTGTIELTVDDCGDPLDVGRERRLFTRKQRIALAVRDGGCRWCGAEPSRCEAHHIDHWGEHGGRTDTADGVLLCRSCHMRLHNQGWRIRRRGGDYWLHPPHAERARTSPRPLKSKSLLRFGSPRPMPIADVPRAGGPRAG